MTIFYYATLLFIKIKIQEQLQVSLYFIILQDSHTIVLQNRAANPATDMAKVAIKNEKTTPLEVYFQQR